MSDPLDDLATELSTAPGEDQKTPAKRGYLISASLGIITSLNPDGTIGMTYMGGEGVPAQPIRTFIPVVGETVLVLVEGTRLWAIGPATGAFSPSVGTEILAEAQYTTSDCGPTGLGWDSGFLTPEGPFGHAAITFTSPPNGLVRITVSLCGIFSTIDNTGRAGLVLSLWEGATRIGPLELLQSAEPAAANTSAYSGRWTYDSGVMAFEPNTPHTLSLVGTVLGNTGESVWAVSDGTVPDDPWGPTILTAYSA